MKQHFDMESLLNWEVIGFNSVCVGGLGPNFYAAYRNLKSYTSKAEEPSSLQDEDDTSLRNVGQSVTLPLCIRSVTSIVGQQTELVADIAKRKSTGDR